MKIKLPSIDLKTALKLAISLLVFFFLWSLYNRCLYADDGWLGEQANSIATHGVVKTKLFDLYYRQFGMENAPLYVYHKLFIWLGGLLIYLTGHFNPYLLKSMSLIAYIILILIILYDYRDRLPNKQISSLILLFYFLALPNLIRLSFIYRPETIVTLLGYLSFRYLSKFQSDKAFLLAGFLAGIATLLHLNGLVFILSGIAYIALHYKRLRSIFFFGLGASVCLLYFADIAYHSAYSTWWKQLNVNYAIIHSGLYRNSFISWKKLNNLFFRSIGELAYSIPLALSLYFITKKGLRTLKAEIHYLGLLIFMLYFFSRSGVFYNTYLHPYAIVLITYAASVALCEENYYRRIMITLLACGFLVGTYKNMYIIFSKNTDIYNAYRIANKIIPHHSRLLASMSIIFNPEFENYDISADFNARIMSAGSDLNHKKKGIHPQAYITRFCIENRFDYLVVDKSFLENFKLDKDVFKLIRSIPKSYWIYKVIPPG